MGPGPSTREAVLAAEGAYVACVHRCIFVYMLSTKKTFILLNKKGDQGEVARAVLFVQVLRFLSEKIGVVGCGCMCIQYCIWERVLRLTAGCTSVRLLDSATPNNYRTKKKQKHFDNFSSDLLQVNKNIPMSFIGFKIHHTCSNK